MVGAANRPSCGLTRKQRLRKRSEIVRVQTNGMRVVSRHFVFLLDAAGRATSVPRLGITATRKIGCAVVRNRAKRLVREVFRRNPEWFPPGIDLVVIVRQELGDMHFDEVQREWESVLRTLRSRAARLLAVGAE